MNWFIGSIPEGISLARSKDGIFVVYVFDQSDSSKALDEKLKSDEISAILFSESFVPIRFENTSEESKQFSQIYPLVIVPSIFFIRATTGIPLEIIGADIESNILIEKIKKIQDVVKKDDVQDVQTSSSQEAPPPESSVDVSKACEGAESIIDEPAQIKPSSIETPSVACSSQEPIIEDVSSVSSSHEESITIEDKVLRAQELLREKQRQKELEIIEREKQEELKRRTIGQNMEKMHREKNENEMHQLAAERRKEKEDDRKARERIKSQIAADKADKEARAAILRGEEPIKAAPSQDLPPAAESPPSADQNSMTRIKFRFVDNSSSFGKFENDSPLSEIVEHLRTNENLQHFSLSSILHQRKFNEADMDISLNDLGLTPSAILLVTPRTSSSPSNIVPRNWSLNEMFWTLISPISSLIFYIGSVFGLTTSPSSENQNKSSDGEENRSAKRPRMEQDGLRNRGRINPVRLEGNIHRLNQNQDSDDENNTWNGNSTQQM